MQAQGPLFTCHPHFALVDWLLFYGQGPLPRPYTWHIALGSLELQAYLALWLVAEGDLASGFRRYSLPARALQTKARSFS